MPAPERVIGLHFFNPAPRMRLVEVVPGMQTSPETVSFALAVVGSLGKQPVTALVAQDQERAAEFVAETLGQLAVDTPTAERLRETLRVFLDEAENAPRAAARLHTHRNTVLQRIARATELLGHDPGDRRLAVELALELAHQLGPRVLSRP